MRPRRRRKENIIRRGERTMTAATQCRLACGLTLDDVAKQMRLKPRTVRTYELHGTDCEFSARRLAEITGAPMEVYLHPQPMRTPTTVPGRETPQT